MKRLLGALIIILLAVITSRFAFVKASELSWFELSSVDINCPAHLENEQVLKLSNLKVGESIFSQDLQQAGISLKELPGVEALTIKRKLPSKVEINLYPDEIVLFVKIKKLYGLTRGLKLIRIAKPEIILPVVTGISNAENIGHTDKTKLCYALELYKTLRSLSENLSGRLSEINFKGTDLVNLYFDPGGVKVIIPLRDYDKALSRLVIMDNKGILGSFGSFDMRAGKMVVKGGA